MQGTAESEFRESRVTPEIFVPLGLNSAEVLSNITPCWPFHRTAAMSITHKTTWLPGQ